MQPSGLVTTTLLLQRLMDSRDDEAWRTFDERFRGVIHATALRLGLHESDAADAAQETIVQALRDYQGGKYDRSRGRLSSWIVSIAHHRIIDMLRARRRSAGRGEGDQPIQPPLADPSPDDVAQAFDLALERQIFEQAWQRLREDSGLDPRTLQAFELAVMRRVPVAHVAAQCGMSPDQVYVVKNRTSRKLRELVEELSSAFRDGL